MRKILLILATSCLTACGGVSEERVNALEAQLKQLQQMATPEGPGADLGTIRQEIANVDTAAKAESTKIYELIETMQKAMVGVPSAAAAGGSGPGAWLAVEDALGVAAPGVTADGDNYKVSSQWLQYEAGKLAAAKPKVTVNKKGGVSLAAIKPGSLPDKLGLKNADTVLAIGDTTITTPADIVTALKKASGGVVVKISRKNKEMALTYSLGP